MNIQHSCPLSSPSTPPPVCSDLWLSLMVLGSRSPLPPAWDAGTLHSRAGWWLEQVREEEEASVPQERSRALFRVLGAGGSREPSHHCPSSLRTDADFEQIPAGAGGRCPGSGHRGQAALQLRFFSTLVLSPIPMSLSMFLQKLFNSAPGNLSFLGS